jgi:hypothetical protein
MRDPSTAPPMNPASDSAPTSSPCEYPHSAISNVNATMIQSRTVMSGVTR